MTQKRWACALTGHRALPPDFNVNGLYDKLEELILRGCDTFFCGMAQGFDLTALKCLVSLKQKYKFYLEACIPYEGHESGFSAESKKDFYELISWCDKKSVMFEKYRDGCFLVRDRYMVDCADAVLAYCTKRTGGTAYTVNYAMKKSKPVIFVI